MSLPSGSRRPWIAVTTRWDPDERVYSQDRRYLDAIEWAGGVPVLIPLRSAEMMAEYGERLDGVLLTGSPTDVDPKHYGAPEHQRLGTVSAERDQTDFRLLEIAENRGLPVLGICYGIQSLNVFRGGTLVQDIPTDVAGAVAHNRPGKPQPAPSHPVSVDRPSRLGTVAGRAEIVVNSYHHQSVADPGMHLRVTAWAPDGVAEAIEDARDRFVVGVQWHPETSWENDESSRELFSAFVTAASARSGRWGG
jgi:putative glutamine amidotransferase